MSKDSEEQISTLVMVGRSPKEGKESDVINDARAPKESRESNDPKERTSAQRGAEQDKTLVADDPEPERVSDLSQNGLSQNGYGMCGTSCV